MKRLFATSALVFFAATASANEYESAIRTYVETNIRPWASDAALVNAIKAQNAVTAAYNQAMIEEMDQTWRAEVGSSNTPTITPVMTSPASEFLREKVNAAGGTISEIILMDGIGLNVAASDITSDYWQGDEAKWQQTYPIGPDAMHRGRRRTRRVQPDISKPGLNEHHRSRIGLVIGAITVGVDVESLL